MSDTAPPLVDSTSSPEAEEAVAVDLGAFSPPPDFVFPDEFDAPVPRDISPKLKQGSYWKRRKSAVAAVFAFAAACFVFETTSFVQELAYYFLPLGYFDWVGIAAAAIGVVMWIQQRVSPGPLAFVRDGTPVVARIRAATRFYHTIQSTQFKSIQSQLTGFQVDYEYRDPKSAELRQSSYRTPLLCAVETQERFELAYRSGDYVTAVVIEDGKDVRDAPYGLLELSPDEEVILEDGKSREALPVWRAPAGVAASFGVLGASCYGLYLVLFSAPVDHHPLLVYVAAGGAVFGLLGAFAVQSFRTKRAVEKKLLSPWITGLGGLLGGLLVALGGATSINAVFDSSEPTYREVRVVEFWETTYRYGVEIIRHYQIEYQDLESLAQRKIPARMSLMREFSVRFGVIEVKGGALAMPWIRRLIPAVPVPLGEDEPFERGVYTTELENEDGEFVSVTWTLKFPVGEDEYIDLSDEALELARKEIEAEE